MKNKVFIPLLLIVVLGAALRLFRLPSFPPSLNWDEVSHGYNAYSILKTGKDEFGKSFPIVFRSFTDFKTPVYIYLISPLIPVFGLNAFTVRLPSFIFSILTIPILYLLISKLTKHKYLASLTCLLLAISPWHILFGRTNFECNVALFFYLTGLYLFYLGLEKPRWLIASAISFAIAIPSYHSQRVITPITLILLFIRYKDTLLSKEYFRTFIFGLVVGLFISLPTLSVATTPGFLARATGLNIFTSNLKGGYGYAANLPTIFNSLINNPILIKTKQFASLYVSYLSPRNMFLLGDYGPRSSFPDLSTFFIWQFPFYIYGLYHLLKLKNMKEFKFIIFSLLFISPIPAAVTGDPYSTIRALPLVIPQTAIIGLGIIKFAGYFKKSLPKLAGQLFIVFLILLSLAKLYSSVIILNEYYRGYYWDYGWKEVVEKINNLDGSLPIIVDNTRFEPYIEIAFFMKYDPTSFQRENQEVNSNEYYTKMDRVRDKTVGRIQTKPINWEKDLLSKQYLIGDSLAISEDQIEKHKLFLISEIRYPDTSIAYRIVKTNPEYQRSLLSGK